MMQRHKYTPLARLPHKSAFIKIMKAYTTAYRVNDDPVWRDAPVLQTRKYYDATGQHVLVTTLHHNRVETFEVERYIAPMIVDAFDANVHFTAEKRKANVMFVNLLKQFYRDGDMIMVLDSPAGQTVRMVRKTFSSALLCVANPSNQISDKLHTAAEWYQCTALEFIRDYPINTPTLYWLDYCCTFDGCASKTVPRLDIEAIFCRGDLPRFDGVLCLTFSLRCYQQQDLIMEVQRFMRVTALKYRYNVHMIAAPFIYNRIVFFQFITVKPDGKVSLH